MLKRILILSSFLLILSGVASAQDISTTTCPGAGCVDLNTSGQGSIGIQVTGTWVGTITFQSSVNGSTFTSFLVLPSNSTTQVSTTTANGIWQSAVAGLKTVRVVFTAYTSGTATVVYRVTQVAKTFGASSGGGSGTVTSVATTSPITGGTFTTTGTIACSTCLVSGGALGTPSSGTATNITGLPEVGLALTDITTRNSTTSLHGFLPKLDNNNTHCISGQGNWVSCAGGGGGDVTAAGNNTFTGTNRFNFTSGLIRIGGTTDPINGGSITWPDTYSSLITVNSGDYSEIDITATSDGFAGTQNTFAFIAKAGDVDPSGVILPTVPAGSFNNIGDIWAQMEDTTNLNSLDAGFVLSNSRQDYVWMTNSAGDFGVGRVTSTFSGVPTPITTANLKIDGATGDSTIKGILTIQANKVFSLAGNFTTSGANPLILTTTGSTNVTLPTSGGLVAGPASATADDIVTYNGTTGKLIKDSGVAISSILTIGAIAQGDLIYGTGTNTIAALTKSATSGAVLCNSGTSNNPAWCSAFTGRYTTSGTAPAVSNTSANSCGTTAATIAGNDNAFKVTVGATAGTSCTVTFNAAWSNAPSCSVSNETTANLSRATSTTTTVILAGTFVAGDVLAGACLGR